MTRALEIILLLSRRNQAPLLLNTYTGSAAAFSTRLLNNRYKGPCVRLRRSSDNAEMDFYFVSGWVDTASITAWLGGASGLVTTWYDQSGNGKNVTQTTASAQPTWSNSIAAVGNKPGMIFAAASLQRLTRAQDLLPSGANAVTLFGVAVRNAADTVQGLVSIGANAVGSRPTLGTSGSATQRGRADVNGSAVTSASGSWPFSTGKAVAARYIEASLNRIMIDLVEATVASGTVSTGTTELVIGRIAGSTSYWDGSISEVGVYGNVTVDWSAIQSNQKAAFSV